MSQQYLPRIADKMLAAHLHTIGAVLIEGPKWCGKTTTAEQQAESHLYMQNPDEAANIRIALDTKPSLLLRGAVPRLIDEWQTASVLWDAVRFAVDRRQEPGQFILTGSAVPPADELPMHTGTGRIARMTMRPMSLYESGDSTGAVSLGALFENRCVEIAENSASDVETIAALVVRGGWPATVISSKLNSQNGILAAAYVDAVVQQDVSRVDHVKRDPFRMRSLLLSLARSVATPAALATIRGDVSAHESGSSVSEKTMREYLNVLSRIFVVEDLSAWNPALRSKTAIRTTPKRMFVDPSIAAAILGTSAEALLDRMEYLGRLFENLCIRDLRVYAEALNGTVYFFRDRYGLEVDAVIVLRDGRWGAVEIKLGARAVDEGAKNLRDLREKINTEIMRGPEFLMILTPGGYGYTRKDGVHVVPITSLRE